MNVDHEQNITPQLSQLRFVCSWINKHMIRILLITSPCTVYSEENHKFHKFLHEGRSVPSKVAADRKSVV